MAGDDEETAKFRSDGTEEEDGATSVLLPVLVNAVEEEDEVEGFTLVCSSVPVVHHGDPATAAATPLILPPTPKIQREKGTAR